MNNELDVKNSAEDVVEEELSSEDQDLKDMKRIAKSAFITGVSSFSFAWMTKIFADNFMEIKEISKKIISKIKKSS